MIILNVIFFFWYSPLCVVQTVQWKLQPELLTYNEIITSVTLWTNRERYYLCKSRIYGRAVLLDCVTF